MQMLFCYAGKEAPMRKLLLLAPESRYFSIQLGNYITVKAFIVTSDSHDLQSLFPRVRR